MSHSKKNRGGRGKTCTSTQSQLGMLQPPSLRAIINDPEEGNAHIRATQSNEVRRHLEDTDSEDTEDLKKSLEKIQVLQTYINTLIKGKMEMEHMFVQKLKKFWIL